MRRFYILAVIFLFSVASRVDAQSSLPAFPGAEGFGANAIGGRGGKVMEVTNLNDSGTGSLRACVEASGPRICVFRTGGTITLNSDLIITNPYITIAGQTAPGGGITLKAKDKMSGIGLYIKTYEAIIRYIRSRPGTQVQNGRAISINAGVTKPDTEQAYNIIIDHTSVSWSGDEIIITWGKTNNITFSWNVIAETLPYYNLTTDTVNDGMRGPNLGDTIGAGFLSLHHNLIAHHVFRYPKMNPPTGPVDLVNNIMYNMYGTGSTIQGGAKANFVNNYIKAGPNTTLSTFLTEDALTGGYYLSGNTIDNSAKPNQITKFAPGTGVSSRYSAPVVTTATANQTFFEDVLTKAGAVYGLNCDGTWFNRRDSVDMRITQSVRDGGPGHNVSPSANRGYITSVDDVGGWPVLDPGTACTDTDHDGMPNAWEIAQGLNANADDSAQDKDGDRYTNIEEYINGSASTGPTPTSGPSATRTPTPTPSLPGDVNRDNQVNLADLSLLLANFGKSGTGDLDGNGKVNLADLTQVLSNFGKSGPTPTMTNPTPTSSVSSPTPTRTPTPIATRTPTLTPTRTPTPTIGGLTSTPAPTSTTGQIPTDANLKVAFIGDSNHAANFENILTMIKNEGADLVLHQGDFAYSYGAGDKDWMDDISTRLGSNFPYIGSVGNHDDLTFGDITKSCVNQASNYTYANFFRCRIQAMGSTIQLPTSVINEGADEAPVQGNYGTGVYATYSTDYKGLKMVFVGEIPNQVNYYNTFINQELANDRHIWKLCSWHKTMASLTAGSHGDSAGGYNIYQSCLNYGAIIANGHNHNYSRTKTLSQITNSSGALALTVDTAQHPLSGGIPGNINNLLVGPGKSFMFVNGAGGGGLYAQTFCTATYPYGPTSPTDTNQGCTKYVWAKVHTPTQVNLTPENDDGHGVLFITFSVNGDPKKAHAYFKDLSGIIIDQFDITAQ